MFPGGSILDQLLPNHPSGAAKKEDSKDWNRKGGGSSTADQVEYFRRQQAEKEEKVRHSGTLGRVKNGV